MLFELEDDVLETIAAAFRVRLLNNETEDSEQVWSQQLVILIQKKTRPVYLTDYRPIAIMAVLQKLYSRVLLLMSCGTLLHHKAPQFAFKPRHQGHEPVFILRSFVEKAIEWDIHIFVLDGDIKKPMTIHPIFILRKHFTIKAFQISLPLAGYVKFDECRQPFSWMRVSNPHPSAGPGRYIRATRLHPIFSTASSTRWLSSSARLRGKWDGA